MEYKKLRFKKDMSELVLQGKKTTTWRVFDDKNITKGDLFEFLVKNDEFAKAKIIDVSETTFKNLNDNDWDGHEKFNTKEEMYATYSKYYHTPVTEDTIIKIIKFEII